MSQLAALPRTIAVVREDNIGDLVVTLPLMAELKKQCPDMQVILFARSYVSSLVPLLKPVDQFVSIEGLTVAQVKALGIDTVLFPQGKFFSDTALVFKQAGVPKRYGTWRSDPKRILTRRNALRWGATRHYHEVQRALVLLDFLELTQPSLQQARAEQVGNFRLELLQDILQRPRPYVVLHTQSNKHGREWPIGHFLELQQHLHAIGFDTVLTGTVKEREVVQGSCAALLAPSKAGGQVVDKFGQLDLLQLAAVLRYSHAVVCAGTGPLHLAAAMGANTIGLYPPFRGADPERWGAVGPRVTCLVGQGGCKKPFWAFELRQSHCNPSGDSCPCVMNITPKQVMAVIEGEA